MLTFMILGPPRDLPPRLEPDLEPAPDEADLDGRRELELDAMLLPGRLEDDFERPSDWEVPLEPLFFGVVDGLDLLLSPAIDLEFLLISRFADL